MPAAAQIANSTGGPPDADRISRRTAPTLSVGSVATSHSAIRIPVTEVDHGSDAAPPSEGVSDARKRVAPEVVDPHRCTCDRHRPAPPTAIGDWRIGVVAV
jgi:hypothetical protein